MAKYSGGPAKAITSPPIQKKLTSYILQSTWYSCLWAWKENIWNFHWISTWEVLQNFEWFRGHEHKTENSWKATNVFCPSAVFLASLAATGVIEFIIAYQFT